MTERDIIICGHGSGTPSLKNLYAYNELRYNGKMTNDVRKQLLRVRHLKALDTPGKQDSFRALYGSILGRNVYSQARRQYVYTPYRGRYYSDCSSSGCATYQRCGCEVPLLNTAAMLNSDLFEDVPVRIKAGHIENPEVLQVGDALLYAGNLEREELSYVGHVEYVYEVPVLRGAGWNREGGDWQYLEDGEPVRDEWRHIDGRWYVFDGAGRMVTGWYKAKEGYYYLAGDGALCTSQWVEDDGKNYYMTRSGLMATSCYVRSEMPYKPGKYIYYWVGEDGAWIPKWDTDEPDLRRYYCAT